MNLKTIYDQILTQPEINWETIDKDITDMTNSHYWPSIKRYFESCIGDVLSQADDLSKVLEGELTEEEFGKKAIISRIVADKMQQIVDFLESHKVDESK